MELRSTPWPASSINLHAAIETLRKKWSLFTIKSITCAMSEVGRVVRKNRGANSLNNKPVAAVLRLWTSSPMWRACAIIALISIFSPTASPVDRTSARFSCIHLRRSITSLLLAPNLSTLPSPSFRFANALLVLFLSATIQTGIEGLVIPAIGPTLEWWWQGSIVTSPDASSFSAAFLFLAQPS